MLLHFRVWNSVILYIRQVSSNSETYSFKSVGFVYFKMQWNFFITETKSIRTISELLRGFLILLSSHPKTVMSSVSSKSRNIRKINHITITIFEVVNKRESNSFLSACKQTSSVKIILRKTFEYLLEKFFPSFACFGELG